MQWLEMRESCEEDIREERITKIEKLNHSIGILSATFGFQFDHEKGYLLASPPTNQSTSSICSRTGFQFLGQAEF